MIGPDRDVYHRCFNRKPEGHAIYHAETSRNLRPGTCGYFDDGGDWTTIAYTLDPKELEENEFGKLDGVSLPAEEVVHFHTQSTSIHSPLQSRGVYAANIGQNADLHTNAWS
jgi:hypothetical protein